jgi:hypothetical protein
MAGELTDLPADRFDCHRAVVVKALCALLAVIAVAVGACGRTAQPPITPSVQPASTTLATHPAGKPVNPESVAAVPVARIGISLLPFSGGPIKVTAISCWSVGQCVAGGHYASNEHAIYYVSTPFVTIEDEDRWMNATVVPGISALPGDDFSGDQTTVTWIRCFPGGNCSAGGVYSTSDVLDNQLFVVNESHGRWDRAIAVPGLNQLNTGNNAAFTNIACPSIGNCAADGTYHDSSVSEHSFVTNEVKGVWQSVTNGAS